MESFGHQANSALKAKFIDIYKQACITISEGRLFVAFMSDDADNKIKLRNMVRGVQSTMKEDGVDSCDLPTQLQKRITDAINFK